MLAPLLFAAASLHALHAHEALFLDGSCAEYAALDAARHEPVPGAPLYVAETSTELWICVTVPPEALGIVDLRVEAPGLASPVNLHVSSQLGEWPADDPAAAPQGPDGPLWWNQHGWYANWVDPGRLRRARAGTLATDGDATARELVLRKQRFGHGAYRLRFELRLHGDPGVVTVYPADEGGAARSLVHEAS